MKKISIPKLLLFLVFGVLSMSGCKNSKGENDKDTTFLFDEEVTSNSELVKLRQQKIDNLFNQGRNILLCGDPTSDTQKAAQDAALNHADFTRFSNADDGKKLFCEIFNILPARDSDLSGINHNSPLSSIFRVEMYNFPLNLTSIALVDSKERRVLKTAHFQHTQPEIPQHLKDLAIDIAVSSPKVAKELGINPSEKDAYMASTKTALNNTKCERSRHLCVAPTFLKDGKALWTIVDLTDNKIVGLRWTQTGENALPSPITERSLQDDNITECFCNTETSIEKNDWKLNYIITSSDGLRISDVSFRGQKVMESAKLVDWHVSYSNTDGFGYSDAVGCPYFSQAAVIAYTPPKVLELEENGKKVGWVLEQSFRSELWPIPCNYNYLQRYEFYNDGRVKVAGASLGRGCGVDGTYRPVFRIDFSTDDYTFSQWSGSAWNPWTKERWNLQDELTKYTPEGYLYKLESAKGGYYMIAGAEKAKNNGRNDNSYTYVTRKTEGKDEGDSDLVTIGPCCNTDYKQGPEKFIEPNPESIDKAKLVVWYVAQLKNDNRKGQEYCWAESSVEKGKLVTKTYPCFFGPTFIPFKK